jgi:primosomal protein N' (replication factor Y)
MQIAQIIPKVKTRGTGIFDYSIPPEILVQIKIGLLVQVPFRGRKVEGIILDIKKSSKFDNLKPILKVIDPIPVVDRVHIELARWMSDYYLTGFTKTLFENIVPPAKRTIKKNSEKESEANQIIGNNTKPRKKFLVVADLNSRLDFYKTAIIKTLDQKKQVIILVPDLDFVPFFIEKIQKEIALISSDLTITKRWKIWDSIRSGKTQIVIGASSAIFAPAKNLGLVIIDQEENENYKNDQSPRFNVLKVADELTKLTNANLVIGSSSPSVETYFEARKNKYLYKIKNKNITEVSTINMTFERGLISEPLKEKIEAALELKQKIIIVLNRKGEGARLFCTNCKWLFKCPVCKLALTPNIDCAHCSNCNKDYSIPVICPSCNKVSLKNIGMTTSKLEKISKDLWPQASIIRIEKDRTDDINSNWDIAIVTNFALKINFPEIELVIILDADQGLNFPGYKTQERNFQTYFNFLQLGKTGLIQTHLPENSLIKNLGSSSYENFFIDEIVNREKFDYPPYVKITRIVYRNFDKSECQKEANIVFNRTNEIIKENNLSIKLLGPLAGQIPKRGYYFNQIILKQLKRSQIVDDFLKTLPNGWIIDVDPFDIGL